MNSSLSTSHSRIWFLLAEKTGDNAQLLHIANALGLCFTVKQLVVRPEFLKRKISIKPSLHHLNLEKGTPLMPPWPDLCITVGRYPSMAALWIKQQSGGHTGVVLLNVPKGSAFDFDLIVTPGIYRAKIRKQVVRTLFPLGGIDETQLAAEAQTFRAQYSALNRPVHALLLGGMGGGDWQAAAFAVYIVKQMKAGHAAQGSLFVSTSRRTPALVAESVRQVLQSHDHLFCWSTNAAYNPYIGLLAESDTVTVTADSLSMMTEVARLAKPLVIAEARGLQSGVKGLIRRLGFGTIKDMRWAVDYLCAHGHAVRLGETPILSPAPLPDDTPLVVERILELIHGR